MESSKRVSPSPGREFRPRKPHKKSRFGCTKCKERRIKCDEQLPRCSRCEKLDIACEYPKGKPRLSINDDLLSPGGSSQYDAQSDRQASTPSPSHLAFGVENLSFYASSISASSTPSHQESSFFPDSEAPRGLTIAPQFAEILDEVELELLEHYYEHTSVDATLDSGDMFALQIGIPNLALQSKPLMSSILAFTAACKCCDIINQPATSPEAYARVRELLLIADRYHGDSLREIQADIPGTKQYDHVLANAAMMTMYGTASHFIRTSLTRMAPADDPVPPELLPTQSRWMRLIRASSVAFSGIHDITTQGISGKNPRGGQLAAFASPSETGESSRHATQRSTPSVEITGANDNKHVLFPILSTTVSSAFEALRAKAQDVIFGEFSGLPAAATNDHEAGQHTLRLGADVGLQSCLVALDILEDIATTLFSPGGAYSAPSSPGTFTSEPDSESFGQLSGVSSWLRRYLASATAEIPSRLPRRIIIAFIHRVPPDYLDYIEAALDHIPAQEDVYSEVLQHPGGSAWLGPSPRHQLAIDIFAHWLVLVLLLDDVWWIGNIGSWELRRVVSFWRSQAWSSSSAEGDQHWWPESMAEIDRQLRRHTRK